MPTQTFKSKIDVWLAIVIAISIGAATFGAFTVMAADPGLWPFAVLMLVCAAGLPLWLMGSTSYTLGDQELLIVSGPFRWRVPIDSITLVKNTKNPLSSPALSLDRIQIDYSRGKSIMISPNNKAQFLTALEARRKALT